MGSSDKESDHQRHQTKDHSDSVIDPALRNSPSPPSIDKNTQGHHIRSDMSSPRRHQPPPPSPPPPITTMSSSNNSHSPSPSVVSVDRSSNSTPHIRRSPPHHAMQPPPAMYSAYQHDHPIMQSNPHHSTHFVPRPEPITHPYIYTHPQFDTRYDHRQHHHDPHRQPYPTPSAYPLAPMSHPQVPHPASYDNYGRQYPLPGQAPVTIVHTDDAATKLTDGIRRRCFNCCTTDTSTWRRSNLSPGKVLCNKCGLFERTHSRPRPDQFPHKRGPLAASTMRGRTPPGTQLPPINAAPYQYHHQPITPLNAGEYHHQQHTLPGLQTWHQNNSSSSSGHTSNNGTSSGGGATNGHGSSDTPQSGPGSPHRRSTLDNSPRTKNQPTPRVSGGRPPFDEPLSSNAAESSDRSPPASVSRSSTSAGGGVSGGPASKMSKEHSASTTITPPPLSSSTSNTGTATASRD